ncbi:MAG: DUF2202 domain-containing protein [Halobacteriaceae archaeon]
MVPPELDRRQFVRTAAGLAVGAGVAVTASSRSAAGATLSEAERADLLYVREEEKLARDVYRRFGERYDLRAFDAIAASEQRHVDAMVSLLDAYDLPDPATDEVGTFANADLQALYDDLRARGETSTVAALRVGGLIEETDVLDLDAARARTDERAVDRVYGNLRAGSENHLRAFVDALAARGVTYAPQVLDADAYAAVVDAT